MRTVPSMATTTVENQPFSRIVEQRKTSSWSIGLPVAILAVVIVALLAWLAAKWSQSSQALTAAQQDAQQQRVAMGQLQQRTSQVEGDLVRLRDPGRTTLLLQSTAKPKKGAAAPTAWGAATWGELADGKTWVRLNAYGLAQPGQGKVYELWFEPASGDPIQAGKLDVSQDGSAFAEGKDLPGVDHGKRLAVALQDENAKAPGEIVIQAALPKMAPIAHASKIPAPGQQATDQTSAPAEKATPSAAQPASEPK